MRLSDLIAKGKLSAYQRWEMTSFEEEKGLDGNATHHSAHTTAKVKSSVLNQKELEELKIKVQKEGFSKGFNEGYQVGLQTSQQECQQILQQELTTFQHIGAQFTSSIQQAELLMAQDILDLAIDLAKAMLKNALSLNHELIIPIIQEAIASLPTLQQPAQLFLNPEDAPLVTKKIGAELTKAGWIIASDAHLKRGDCRIETLKNQINASLNTRWKQLTDALGRDNNWYVAETDEPTERK